MRPLAHAQLHRFRCLAAATAIVLAPHPASALDDLGRYVFIANRASAEIAIIDSRSDAVAARLRLGAVPDLFVLSEDSAKLIASHRHAKRLSIADLTRLEAEAVIDLGFEPDRLQLDSAGETLAVSGENPGAVILMSVAAPGTVRAVPGIADPGALMFSRDGDRLFVASRSEARISVVDVARGVVVGEIRLPGPAGQESTVGVVHLSRTPGGGLGFASRGGSGLMTVIDLKTLVPLGTVALPGPAMRAYPTADSQYVLVPNERDRSVSLVSTWTLKESERLPGATGVTGINTGMFERIAVVLSRVENKAVLLDLDQRRSVRTISLPSRPETGITADAGKKVYIALSGSNRVAVVDLVRQRLVKMIDGVGEQPWAVQIAGGSGYCH